MRRLVLLGALGLFACGTEEGAVDAGGAPDAALGAPDGGAAVDAGVVVDAGAGPDAGGASDAGAVSDAGVTADAGPPPPPPARVLFIGNSFTLQGPVPALVESMAAYAGFGGLDIQMRAVGGRSLRWHREDASPEGAPARVEEGWDAVVLQEYSTGPTDQVGPAERFKEDATWFHDLARAANPGCRVVLYETWARRFDHGIYPDTFSDPMQMQDELRFHYDDAADRYIPEHATEPADVRVARVGDAWEAQLSGGEPPRLHASDRYHAGPAGQYLNALVLYGTLFGRRTDGMVPLGAVEAAVAQQLQDTADGVLGAVGYGAYAGGPAAVPTGDPLRVDFGPDPEPDSGFRPIEGSPGTAARLETAAGALTTAYVTAFGFTGTQTGGQEANDLGLAARVSRDSLWVGTFDGHAAALDLEARLVVRGLPEGRYRVTLFASRNGDDSGNGRLTRYRIGAETRDLDPVDNRARMAVFEDVGLDRRGEILVRVAVSPDGAARFGYAGALWVERVGP